MIFSALVAATCAAPAADAPPAYGAPAPYAPHPVAKLPPQPFAYQYGVKDDYSGASFDKSESQNAEGEVAGKKKYFLNFSVGF